MSKIKDKIEDERAWREKEMEYLEEKKVVNHANWKEVFPSFRTYLNAVTRYSHPQHKEAMNIWKNRRSMLGEGVELSPETERKIIYTEKVRESLTNPFNRNY